MLRQQLSVSCSNRKMTLVTCCRYTPFIRQTAHLGMLVKSFAGRALQARPPYPVPPAKRKEISQPDQCFKHIRTAKRLAIVCNGATKTVGASNCCQACKDVQKRLRWRQTMQRKSQIIQDRWSKLAKQSTRQLASGKLQSCKSSLWTSGTIFTEGTLSCPASCELDQTLSI